MHLNDEQTATLKLLLAAPGALPSLQLMLEKLAIEAENKCQNKAVAFTLSNDQKDRADALTARGAYLAYRNLAQAIKTFIKR